MTTVSAPAGARPSLAGLRVMGVFAHPDDESFSAGGLLALAAAGGAQVTVVCATRGEAGAHPGPPAHAGHVAGDVRGEAGTRPGPPAHTGHAAGDTRAAELAAACQALGARPPRFLGWRDGALAGVDAASGQACVADLLSELRPHLVVTQGPDGAYGHADHLACTAWVRAAVAAMAPAERPRLLLAVFPRGLFVPVWQRLRKLPGVAIASEIQAASLGVPAASVDLRLDIRAVAAPKLTALAAHRSQLPGGDPMRFLAPALPRAALARLMAEEWYVHADGPALPARASRDGAGDIIDAQSGITP
jgi:N-acetyl-1-D-myo-inositol-2-amino-2-deoxy-alpha-D-glucopyranoside deacetylase